MSYIVAMNILNGSLVLIPDSEANKLLEINYIY